MKLLGLIVNPYAGLGGKVGLKGSDGPEIIKRALKLGAIPLSPERTVEALKALKDIQGFTFITYPGLMGEDEVRRAGLEPKVIGVISKETTADDTKHAASDLLKIGVDLLVFSGGDGTARDIYSVVKDNVPVLGIPTGVKIHSGVFAIDLRRAGIILRKFIDDETDTKLIEVMDIDEKAYRDDSIQAKLYGYMNVIYHEEYIQGSKEGSGDSDESAKLGIANEFFEEIDNDTFYILGPGTTLKPISDKLGIQKTLLGIDIIQGKQLVASDVNEKKLLKIIRGREAKLYVTVIGGQGFVFGRGNQQLSPEVIRAVGLKNIKIVATPNKLTNLRGRPLRVDTGDSELDEALKGYHKVNTGYRRRTVYKIE